MDPYERAIACAFSGDVDFFKTVAPDILLEARDRFDRSVLTVAATEGHLDCCEVIVERCTQLLYHHDAKWSVLHYVAAFNRYNNVENIMRFLITADSKPDLELGGGAKIPNHRLLTMQDGWGQTALHLAVKYGYHSATKLLLTKLLLEADRDFELLRMVDKYGQTCLHIAAKTGNHSATKLLLETDREFEWLRMVNEDGRTCLHMAAEYGNHVSADLIIQAKPDIEFLKMTERQSNQTALHIAVEKKMLAIVQLLLEADHSNDLLAMVDSKQQTAVHYAVEEGNLDMVKLMCEAGLDKQLLSMPDYQGNTPVHLAVKYNNLEIVRLLTEGDMETKVAMTCAKRGDVDFFKKVAPEILLGARDARDINTVLTVAAKEGHLDCCEVIVERCTPLLYRQDKYKWSVLHDVANSSNNLENIMRFLITADSKPDLEFGGGGNIPNKRLLTMQNRWGGTALHLAVQNRKHWATKLLLEADRDFELLQMVDNNGRTCLHIAAEKGDHVLATMVEKISAHTANITKQTPYIMAMGKILSDGYGGCSKSGDV